MSKVRWDFLECCCGYRALAGVDAVTRLPRTADSILGLQRLTGNFQVSGTCKRVVRSWTRSCCKGHEKRTSDCCPMASSPMSSMEIDKAFQRHPRPQAPALGNRVSIDRFSVPTKAALLERSLRKQKAISTDPWSTLLLQGDLVQGGSRWHLCIHDGIMTLLKSADVDSGKRELEKLKMLSNHPHVTTVKQVFESGGLMYFRFDYSRFTLEEILNVHLRLDESHLRIIASSVCAPMSL
jgi:hypothetical protein